jgi:moderate conductance mechanosensitive channel
MDFDEAPWPQLIAVLQDPVLPIITIVVIAGLVLRYVSIVVHRIVKALLDREVAEGTARELSAVEVTKRIRTLDSLATNVLRAFILIIAGVMILGELKLNIGPAIAGLGVVGIAVGFGAQSLVRDYFTGALILVENQFSRGDVVTLAGVSGTVEDFSLRRTTLRDLDGVLHTVPNGEIKVASNRTRVWARINQDVLVTYGTDIEHATLVVDAVGRGMAEDPLWRRRLLEPPRVERIEALGEFGITLKILGTVRAPEQWAAGGELRKRLLAAFAANGIEIPRPQRVVFADRPPNEPAAPAGPRAPSDDELADEGD